MAVEYQYLGTGAAEGMPATFCACPVCLRSMQEGGKSLRMRACTLLGEDVLIDLSPDIHAQKLRFGLRLDRLKCIVFTHSHPDHQDIYALQNRGVPSRALRPDVPEEENVLDLYGNLWVKKRFLSACAGAAIYRREVFDEIGYFDEMHFAYLEDIDVGYRAKIAGYYNRYCPSAKVFHVGSGTSGSKYNSFKVKLAARNNVYLNYKNMPAPQLLINSIPITAGIAGKYCFFKKLGLEKDYVAGVLEGIKTVKKTRKVPYRKEDFHNYLAIEWELIYGAALYIYEFSRRQIRKKMAGPAKS